jgi:SHS2 domain-containing protein
LPYRYIEEEATADVAFEAWGASLDEVFRDAGEAVTKVMVDNPEAIEPHEERTLSASNEELDMVLFGFLEQIVYYKDSEQLILRIKKAEVAKTGTEWHVTATAAGEKLDPSRHHQMVDVKAITLHQFTLRQQDGVWRAHVILDI